MRCLVEALSELPLPDLLGRDIADASRIDRPDLRGICDLRSADIATCDSLVASRLRSLPHCRRFDIGDITHLGSREALGGDVFHYRDNTGLEADAIIDLPNRTERKDPPQDLNLLERLLILGRKPQSLPEIPAETRLA